MFQEFTGREYLKIDIASSYGLDKVNWDERLVWFDLNEKHLDQLVNTAKEPALFYAGVQAWRDTLQGKPIGHMISLDATSSGLQILAALTGDHKAAAICNVIDTGNRENAYKAIYEEMLDRVGEAAQISLDDTKQAIMTALYSSKAEPKRVFGTGELLDVFYETMEDMCPGAWDLNEAFLALWNPEAFSHDWVLPDNFHVHIKTISQVSESVHFLNAPYEVTYKINAPFKGGRSLGANTIHSLDGMIVREMTRRCDYDLAHINFLKSLPESGPLKRDRQTRQRDHLVVTLWDHYKTTGYLSARILENLDAQNIDLVDRAPIDELIGSLPAKPFKLVSNHDCFRCLPHYGNDIRKQYALQLKLIAKSNILSSLISQIVNRPVKIGKLNPTLWQRIDQTNYALS